MNPKKVRNVRVHVTIEFFFWLLICTIFVLDAVHVVVQRCVSFVLSGLRRNGAVFSPSDEHSTASTPVSDSSSGRLVSQSPLIAGGELADTATASSIGSQSSVPEESSDISPSVRVRPPPIPIGISHSSAEPFPAVSAMDVSPPYLAPQQAQIATSSQPVPAISSMAPFFAAFYSGQVSQTAAYQRPDLANRLRPDSSALSLVV